MALVNFLLQVTALVLSYSCSQAADDGCVKVPVINDFYFRQIAGNWYGQEIGNDEEAALKCLRYKIKTNNYKSGANFTVQRFNNVVNPDGTKPAINLFPAYQIGTTSEYRILYYGVWRAGWIIGLDPKSWVVYYACVPELREKGVVFIVTKEQVPSNATLEEARSAAKNAGLNTDPSYLKSVDQANCH